MLKPEIRIIKEKKLLGKHVSMSLSNNRTAELWRSFMPLKKSILNRLSKNFISMQVYGWAYLVSTTSSHNEWTLKLIKNAKK